jgi:hypothetical protein
LAEASPAHRLQLVSQALVLAPQPITLAPQPLTFSFQLRSFALEPQSFLFQPRAVGLRAPQSISKLSNDLFGVARRRVVHAACYATFMISVQGEIT